MPHAAAATLTSKGSHLGSAAASEARSSIIIYIWMLWPLVEACLLRGKSIVTFYDSTVESTRMYRGGSEMTTCSHSARQIRRGLSSWVGAVAPLAVAAAAASTVRLPNQKALTKPIDAYSPRSAR